MTYSEGSRPSLAITYEERAEAVTAQRLDEVHCKFEVAISARLTINRWREMKKRITPFLVVIVIGVRAAVYATGEPPVPPPPLPTQAALGPASQVLKFLEGKKDVPLVDDFILVGDTKVELIPVTSDHDAYIFFGRVGCKPSVPLMIGALSEFESAAKAGKEMICTSTHLHHALIAQTGEDFGYDRAAWQKWWDQVGKNLPADHFDPESNSKKRANQRLTSTAITSTASATAAPAVGATHH